MLDMCVWLRGRRVIAEEIEVLIFIDDPNPLQEGKRKGNAELLTLLNELKVGGERSIEVNDLVSRIENDEEKIRRFLEWGVKDGYFEVVWKIAGT